MTRNIVRGKADYCNCPLVRDSSLMLSIASWRRLVALVDKYNLVLIS